MTRRTTDLLEKLVDEMEVVHRRIDQCLRTGDGSVTDETARLFHKLDELLPVDAFRYSIERMFEWVDAHQDQAAEHYEKVLTEREMDSFDPGDASP